MLKLKLQYFSQLMQRADSLEKTLMLGKIEGWRKKGQQGTRWLDGISDSMDMSLSELSEMVTDRDLLQSVGLRRIRHDSATEQRRSQWAASRVFTHLHPWANPGPACGRRPT